MKLNAIRASGLKGRDLAVTLTGCDLFVGPNGSGKSTHLLAVLAGLRGLATTPTDATREYIGPSPAGHVELDFGERSLVRDLSQTKGRAVAAADALAIDIAGPHVVRWDLSDFARATDSARAKLLERVCSVSGSAGKWSSTRIEKWLVDAGVWSDTEAEEGEEAKPESPADGLFRAYPLDVDGAGDLDAGRWVASALSWAADKFTACNAAAKQAAQTAAGMAEERAAAAHVAGSLDEARAAVARHEADASTARSELAAAKATGTARQDHVREGDRAAEEVGAAADALTLAEEERTLARQLAESFDVDALRGEHESASVAAGETMAAVTHHGNERRARHTEWHVTLDRKTATEAHRRTLAALVEHAGTCRHCAGADPLALADRIATASEAAEDAAVDEVLAHRKVKAAEEAEDQTTLARGHALARAEAAKRKADEAGRGLAEALRGVKRAEDAITAATARNERAVATLTAWSERPVPAAPIDTSLADAQLVAAEGALATAKGHLEALIRQQEREAAMQRAIVAREEAAARLEAVKALGTALRKLQAAIARDAYGPITSEADALLAEAGSDLRVEFRDESDYGARRGEVYIHFAALSDAERATVGAALCYAFARLTKAPWRVVVLDGLEAIDDYRLPGLIGALVAAGVDGRIDNVIGAFATVEDTWIKAVGAETGATVHWLGAQAQLALVSP